MALDTARQIKAGVVWVNSTNLFDAAAGFGGYRESGFGREGGKEGLYEYTKVIGDGYEVIGAKVNGNGQHDNNVDGDSELRAPIAHNSLPAIDRTPKNYVGGKQARPDSGYSRPVYGPGGQLIGEVGEGNRKDIRNAVEAARAAGKWAEQTAHGRAQILYYIAENLSARADEFARRLASAAGCRPSEADLHSGRPSIHSIRPRHAGLATACPE